MIRTGCTTMTAALSKTERSILYAFHFFSKQLTWPDLTRTGLTAFRGLFILITSSFRGGGRFNNKYSLLNFVFPKLLLAKLKSNGEQEVFSLYKGFQLTIDPYKLLTTFPLTFKLHPALSQKETPHPWVFRLGKSCNTIFNRPGVARAVL